MTFKNDQVLEFYKELPFNIYGDIDSAVNQIKKYDPLEVYPELKKIFDKIQNKKINIIDFGCGGGWLVNSLNYHHASKVNVKGVDFNPTVIQYANKIKDKLNLKSDFATSDLFSYVDDVKYDIIISLGVLHHTNNCIEAVRHICKFNSSNAFVFLGLYHKYGRLPFLEHFSNMKGKSDDFKFLEYKKLHNITDEKKLYSWFRDQVLHPHETQHTFEEIYPIIESKGYKILSTSINNFNKISNKEEIIELEKTLSAYSKDKINKLEYFPGFFIIVGEKNET